MLLHGIFPPITTPFYQDGKIYFRKLEQNVEQYSRAPIAGIVVQGSTNPPAEWLRLTINPKGSKTFDWTNVQYCAHPDIAC